jgi:hypothetical protein
MTSIGLAAVGWQRLCCSPMFVFSGAASAADGPPPADAVMAWHVTSRRAGSTVDRAGADHAIRHALYDPMRWSPLSTEDGPEPANPEESEDGGATSSSCARD